MRRRSSAAGTVACCLAPLHLPRKVTRSATLRSRTKSRTMTRDTCRDTHTKVTQYTEHWQNERKSQTEQNRTREHGSMSSSGKPSESVSDPPSLQQNECPHNRISQVLFQQLRTGTTLDSTALASIQSGNRCSAAAMFVSTIFLAPAITAEYIVANTVIRLWRSRCDALDERNSQLVYQMMVGISTTMKQWRLSACSSLRRTYYPVCRKILTWLALLGLLSTMTLEARSLYSTLHRVTLLLSSSLGTYASGRNSHG